MKQVWKDVESGRLVEAELGCRRHLEGNPGFSEAEFALAVIAYNRGDMETALDQLGKVLIRDPNLYPALTLGSRIFFETNRFERSLDLSRRGLRIQQEEASLHQTAGRCLLVLKRPLEALASFEAAILLDPRQAAGYFGKADAFAMLGTSFDAVEAIAEGVDLAPTKVRLEKLMELESSLGRSQAALDAAKRLLKVDPANLAANLFAARSLVELGRPEESDSFWKAAKQSPGYEWRVDRQEAYAHSMSGDLAKTIASLEHSIAGEPRQGGAYQLLFTSRKATDDDILTIDQLENLSSVGDLDPSETAPLEFALAKAWDDLENHQKAMGHYERGNAIRLWEMEAEHKFSRETLANQFAAHRKLFQDPIPETPHPVSGRPIFVVGMMRSGTTLVEQILSAHPDVAGAGEQDFWTGSEAILVDPEGPCLRADLLEDRRASYLRLLSSFGEGKSRVVDKNPANLLVAGLIHHAFPDSPIIHMRRNPADIAISMWMTDASVPFITDRGNIVFAIKEAIAQAEHWQKVLPSNRFLDLHYEDLVNEPERWIRTLLDFCGLPWSDSCLHAEVLKKSVKTPSVWQVRQPIYRSSVDRWKLYEPWLQEFKELL